MKKILAVTLAVLMLLPVFASLAYASFDIPAGTETKNVASEATLEVVDTNNIQISVSDVNLEALVDGNKATGTNSPLGQYYSYVLSFSETKYFTDIVVACNGGGKLANGSTIGESYNVHKLMVKVYYGAEETFASEILDVSKVKEIKVPANVQGDKVEIYKVLGSGDRNEYMWEIETYAPDMELCSAQVENVAQDAVFSATGGNANYWWAMDYKTWVDGDPNTGSHSPKGRNYSVWMHFPQEYLFSQIDLVCNTEGGATLAAGQTLTDRYIGNSMMRVLVYNYNEDLVWDSDMVDTSTITTLSVAPYVEGAIIEIRFYNGNFGGGEYMYEVSTYAQSGDHVFETVSEDNPTCLVPGYREYQCHCGKVIKKSIDATGFHKWNEGEITKGPSTTDNGILTVTCTGCGSTKLYDVPATGHNWDDGKKVAASCDQEGYTLYTCTDADCTKSYKADYTQALVHQWDDGKITQKPTVDAEGVITYKCSICNGEKYGRIRKHKYTDNVTDFTSASISKTEVVINKDDANYTNVYTGGNPAALFDGDMLSNWYGPAGTYIVFTLDKEYIFTSGFFYMSANYSFGKIEFLNDKNEVVATYDTGAVNHYKPTDPMQLDMLDKLSAGVKASKIKVTTVGAKWANGSAATMHELQLKVHSCNITEDDYILYGASYKAPTCNSDGSCLAVCQVCENQTTVKLPAGPNVGHKYTTITPDVAPTCVETGLGHATCTLCNKNITGITIPATGKHNYTVDTEIISAKCGFAGVGNITCDACGKVGTVYEIDPTGVHDFEWATKSQASYTAVGKTEYCCIYCDTLDENTEENVKVAEKTEIPADIIEFVSVSSSADATNGNVLSITYKIKLEYLAEIEETCDVRVITFIKDANGREASVESYGKYATNSYNEETGEFTVTIRPKTAGDVFEISTCVRLMNFRGVVYKYFTMGEYGSSISMDQAK